VLALPVLIQDRHGGTVALPCDMDAVWRGFSGISCTEHTPDEVLLLDLLARIAVQVTNEVIARGAVAVFDGEARRINRHAYAPPCAVERFGQRQQGFARFGLDDVGL